MLLSLELLVDRLPIEMSKDKHRNVLAITGIILNDNSRLIVLRITLIIIDFYFGGVDLLISYRYLITFIIRNINSVLNIRARIYCQIFINFFFNYISIDCNLGYFISGCFICNIFYYRICLNVAV